MPIGRNMMVVCGCTNYRKALQLNPCFAIAAYRTAQLFKTQTIYGTWQLGYCSGKSEQAITADPKFAPAYFELYYYNLLYKKDFPTAENLCQ